MSKLNSEDSASSHENHDNGRSTDTVDGDVEAVSTSYSVTDHQISASSSSVTEISQSENKASNHESVASHGKTTDTEHNSSGSSDTVLSSHSFMQSNQTSPNVSPLPLSTHLVDRTSPSSQVKSRHGSAQSERGGSPKEPNEQESMESLICEQGGAFHFVDTEDIKAEHVKSRRNSQDSERRASSSQIETTDIRGRKLMPEYNSRPARSKSAYAASPPREQSKDSAGKSKCETYRMSEEEKEKLERQKAKRREQEDMERERKEREEQRKKEICNAAFHEWLKVKRDEAAKRRRENREEHKKALQKRSEQKNEGKDAFSEWLKVKRQQEKKAKKVDDERDKEDAEASEKRSRKQAERAFKKWLRKKHREARLARSQSKTQSVKQQQQQQRAVKSTNNNKASRSTPAAAAAH